MENIKYYNYLEKLRKSGITNMYGAAPYLQVEFGLNYSKAVKILMDWMKNYNQLKNKLGW